MIGIYLALFFGGAFLVNGIPHFVSALLGQPFPTPFAKPPGEGNSSTIANALWGAFNFLVAYVLLCQVIFLDLRSPIQAALAGGGGLVMALFLARHFGRVRGR